MNNSRITQSQILNYRQPQFYFSKDFVSRIQNAWKNLWKTVDPHSATFPRQKMRSHYRYQPQEFLKKGKNSHLKGINRWLNLENDELLFLFLTIDFRLLATCVYQTYAKSGGLPYDPASMIALWFCFFHHDYDKLYKFYNLVAGTSAYARMVRIRCGFHSEFPSYSAWLDFLHQHLTEKTLTKMFLWVFNAQTTALGMAQDALTITSIDGHLYNTFARFRGCNRYEKTCRIPTEQFISAADNLRWRLEKEPQNVRLYSPLRLSVTCPCAEKWTDNPKKAPAIPLANIHLEQGSLENLYPAQCPPNAAAEVQLVYHLKLEGLLNRYQLRLKLDKNLNSAWQQNWKSVRCPRIPSDGVSRWGVKGGEPKRFVFGANMVTLTTYLPQINLELPAAVTIQFGSDKEAEASYTLGEQIKEHYHLKTLGQKVRVMVADAKWDCEQHYHYLHREGTISVTAINARRQKKEKELRGHKIDIATRRPKATPCGLPMTPNGVDYNRRRVTYTCAKACLNYVKNPRSDCPFRNKPNGQTAHFKISDDLSVFSEIPRGSRTEKEIKKLRSGSERINSICQKVAKDHCTLHSGNAQIKFGILMATAILLVKVYYFIEKVQKKLRTAWQKRKPWRHLTFDSIIPRWLQRFFYHQVTET